MTFPYKSPLRFGYESGGEESDTVIANGLGMYDDEPEHKMKKKTKPDVVAKNESPVTINLSLGLPRDYDDTFRMKGGIGELPEDSAEELRQAINSKRVPTKQFESVPAMLDMYYELGPNERKNILHHLKMAMKENAKKY